MGWHQSLIQYEFAMLLLVLQLKQIEIQKQGQNKKKWQKRYNPKLEGPATNCEVPGSSQKV